ncbi:MAG TPA: response regulator [Pseudomonadota bacterium]|jgi:CheY-like chemotaxis protein|nr:response regulator [Pseudomonadota bacterium]
MELLDDTPNNRILIVDDNAAIHEDFRKILNPKNLASSAAVDALAQSLFEEEGTKLDVADLNFELHHATQGKDALEMVKKALVAEKPFALAFVDVRMPPGWNGVETVEKIWERDTEIEIVLCTAYSDFTWEEIRQRLRSPDRLLILRKPFDAIEVLQLAYCLTKKWFLRRQAACRMQDLEIMVEERMKELEQARKQLETAAARQKR